MPTDTQNTEAGKPVVVREFGRYQLPGGFLLDLNEVTVKGCLGCWSCWLKTPGRCVHRDLDDFYRAFLAAGRVLFFPRVAAGFVTGNMKSLFDRMIPHYLPYIHYKTGESMHKPRHKHNKDTFLSPPALPKGRPASSSCSIASG